ncbi:succinate dehydrogenase, cytochrome b556 subunit [Candidatus Nucleicultrix amoebiphila]|uniref:Succinate dehydrogenase cytochrome b556 subunit n=1 Tax=Candidatus Nucleicultrix amoebiphila FS5 TaxID=1414854 RepID=A0A1W6N5Y1_9PROT|nr:succinate dehydrogenase, cytochrome b556 subunit [Candidatus Nucleicultrix amoebiphila]ARN85198.1 succinate dehydrogenase [Candidatus Nucleicultrix amoebiphila FS5]
MQNKTRPLSPHLQIYRWQLTSVLSITHRATGLFLSLGILVYLAWLIALLNSESYDTFQMFFQTIPGRLLMFGWVFSFFYHLANGIRHLFWDAGYGFELRTTYISGWVVVGVAFALTLAFALGS